MTGPELRQEVALRAAEARGRAMTWVGNRTFRRRPTRLDRLLRQVLERATSG